MAIAELTLDDKSNMRLALEERIVSLLGLFRKWSPEVLATLDSYYRTGGYFSQEDFERFAKVKIEEER